MKYEILFICFMPRLQKIAFGAIMMVVVLSSCMSAMCAMMSCAWIIRDWIIPHANVLGVCACQSGFLTSSLAWVWEAINPLGLSIALWFTIYAFKEIFKVVFMNVCLWLFAISVLDFKQWQWYFKIHFILSTMMQCLSLLIPKLGVSKLPSRPPVGSIASWF